MSEVFERQYQKNGLASQRRYPNEALIRFLSTIRKGGKVLELGCGSGANLWMIAREGFDACGIDTSETGILLCKKMLNFWGVEANCYLQDMRKLTFEDRIFDAIVDVVSMQHVSLDDHAKALSEVYRCLKPGGLFFSWHLGRDSAPYWDNLLYARSLIIDECTIGNIENPKLPLHGNGPTCFLDECWIRNLVQGAGLELRSIEETTRKYQFGQQVQYFSIVARRN